MKKSRRVVLVIFVISRVQKSLLSWINVLGQDFILFEVKVYGSARKMRDVDELVRLKHEKCYGGAWLYLVLREGHVATLLSLLPTTGTRNDC